MLAVFNRWQPHFTGHVLLYHATYTSVPGTIQRALHNVTPDVLRSQLVWLKGHFDVVPVDDLFDDTADMSGRAAVTFDDAYESVLHEAIPIIEALNIPCTIFINGVSLSSQPFWRDKVRYLINQALVAEFLSVNKTFAATHGITAGNFYRASKKPSVNNANLDSLIDDFLERHAITPKAVTHCISEEQMMNLDAKLVTFGNHTQHHYVMSSLSATQQECEIANTDEILVRLGVPRSRVFSVPFGGEKDINDETVEILKGRDYRGFLYSRGAINLGFAQPRLTRRGLPYRERYMVEPGLAGFQKQILKMGVQSIRQLWY